MHGNLMAQYNLVKEALLDALVKEKLVSQEHADAIKSNYAVIVTKRSWLGRFLDKFFFKADAPDEEMKIVVVRIVK